MAASECTVGTALIDALVANGVDLVFGIPGTHNLELYRGLADSPVRHVVTRHEQGAAYAADGYARATGRSGVVVTTSGPGLTNALTGMANAYADSVPMLVISPGVPTGTERGDYGILHEAKDQRAAADSLVARSVRPGTPQQAVDAVHEFFARLRTERPRPVHIEVPLDVLDQPWNGDAGAAWAAPYPPAPAPDVVESVGELLCTVPTVLVAGGGAVDAGAEVTALAEAVDAPVLTTPLGKGVLDENHPLSAGPCYGADGSAPLLRGAGVVLALGTELRGFDQTYGPIDGTLVRVDIDPAQLHKNTRADVAVHADVPTAVAELHRAVGARAPRRDPSGASLAAAAHAACAAAAGPRVREQERINLALARALPDDVVVTGDSSQVSYLGTGPHWRFDRPRRYLVTDGYSTLGYAVPAAIGAKLALPERPVVALLGDGALMFSVQELMTAAELGLSLPIVVVDNAGFREIRQNMLERDIKPFAVTLDRPDLAGLATAMGCRGVLARSEEEAADAAVDGLTAGRPTLVVVAGGD